jgi:hypothetical protein
MNRELSGRIDNLSIFKKDLKNAGSVFAIFLGGTLSEWFCQGNNPGMAKQSAI